MWMFLILAKIVELVKQRCQNEWMEKLKAKKKKPQPQSNKKKNNCQWVKHPSLWSFLVDWTMLEIPKSIHLHLENNFRAIKRLIEMWLIRCREVLMPILLFVVVVVAVHEIKESACVRIKQMQKKRYRERKKSILHEKPCAYLNHCTILTSSI